MSRTQRRVSRGLIGLLVVTIAVGLIFYFHDTSRSKAIEASSASPQITIAPPVANPAPKVELVGPATQPSNSAPSTQPTIFITQSTPATQPTFHAASEHSAAAGPHPG